MIKLKIITRCTRLNYLEKIYESIIPPSGISLTWVIIFDTARIKNNNCMDFFNMVQSDGKIELKVVYGKTVIPNDYGHDLINKEIDATDSDNYIYVLDDDNALHENFYSELIPHFRNKTKGILFNQYIGYKDFTNSEYRTIDLDDIEVGKIDMAQFVLKKSLLTNKYRIPVGHYVGDGMFISKLYRENKNDFVFVDKTLCYYNNFQTEPVFWLPKVMYIGNDEPIIETDYHVHGIEKKLNVMYVKDTSNFYNDLVKFNPDSIMISEDMDMNFLMYINSDISKRCMIISETQKEELGFIAYQCAMNYILNQDYKGIVSYVTPTYNTGVKLYDTYRALQAQTCNDWEWVIVDDSTDNGFTLSIIKEIASVDYRVKYYDFSNKSGGVIGESKYRGFMLASGEYLAEYDHDDYIKPETTDLIIKAFRSNDEVGFVYSDSAEVGIDFEVGRYGDGFALGYGSYREEEFNGRKISVINSNGINPLTIRHIVGVPNHVRVWRKDIYHKIGGHKRRLSIADDYELIVRTFLETKMMLIPKLLYVQYIYNNQTGRNTHDLTRADIQRRVDYIAINYNKDIKERFEALGGEDWAYNECPHYPLQATRRFGDSEGAVNLVYTETLEKTEK
jgi:glycosyltransferase involved in cell wall biosynthesis